ncbi:helix-turn-helix domain-containing protein [Actinosynnema pretiosum subsp. pretiosum]|uniref:Transcriptional regulator, XRE family n=2 Tax=Actinosynnema TaxID=40566 RepID=C6WEN0_ACTMD|nr:helix-turn-helix transcriptional regulator [Actinosynnema mirum]ACU37830.1 transcriptional regulator, XRE family [Actinosynnema mirum DSM 43827]AXX31311.1 HigA protein (antitoxin to HigB) [Actinosynnema pretiosum subsp. pretiosum]QUF04630.1 helix-turn-helix domain-containing protein [Actinosynnema pretiosum subsp. pretiosum]
MVDERQGGTELGRYLRARRAQIGPEEVGLVAGPGLRRTPGLRREELSALAGISIDYYTRLERGRERRPSPAVVDALARALKLVPDEVAHLRELVERAARSAGTPARAPSRSVRPGVKLILESLRPNPAYVVSRVDDVLAANPGGTRLFAGIDDWPAKQRNLVRYLLLHPMAREVMPERDRFISGCVAGLRALAGTDPDAPDLARLLGELLVKSPEFARLWERYDVRRKVSNGRKVFRHPDVGEIHLGYQMMSLDGAPDQKLVVYFAEPGSPEHDALVLLDMLGAAREAEVAAEDCAEAEQVDDVDQVGRRDSPA